MFNIGPLEFFPPQPLRSFTSLGSTRLYALVARDEAAGSPVVVYLGKSIELAGGIDKHHHAVARWRCFGRRLEQLMVCESAQAFSDAELVAIEARLVARFQPELNEEKAANEVDEPWWGAFFTLSHKSPEGSL